MCDLQGIFDRTATWYTCLSAFRGCFQGIIATPPANQVLIDCIDAVMRTPDDALNQDYHLITAQHDLCKDAYGSACDGKGLYRPQKPGVPNLVLFQESCDDAECEFTSRDRYNFCCNIRDDTKRHLFRTRHPDYPWKTLPIDETSLLHRKGVVRMVEKNY